VLPLAAAHLGLAHAMAGRHAEARPLLREAVETAARGWDQSLQLVMLGEGHLRAGELSEAAAVAARAVGRAVDRGERGSEAWARRLVGEIAVERGDAAGEGQFRAAMVLAERLGMAPLVAHCHLGLGRLYLRTGEPRLARDHLDTAATMYGRMGMRHWLAQAEAARGSLA
jgi:hypothetical protein